MLQAVATFGAGVFAGQGLSACSASLPNCGLRGEADGEGTAFKLSVHVHGASVPELGEPGMVARPRPRLQVMVGSAEKETEFADFVGTTEQSSGSWTPRPKEDLTCPWQFGDTLTFSVLSSEAHRGCLRLRLSSRSDFCLGPLQVQLPHCQHLGEGVLNLKEHLLPACAQSFDPFLGAAGVGLAHTTLWQSPAMVVSLRKVLSDKPLDPVAQILISVSINTDPTILLKEVERAEKTLADRVVGPLLQCAQATAHCSSLCGPLSVCQIEERRLCKLPATWLSRCEEPTEVHEALPVPSSDERLYATSEVPCQLYPAPSKDDCFQPAEHERLRTTGLRLEAV